MRANAPRHMLNIRVMMETLAYTLATKAVAVLHALRFWVSDPQKTRIHDPLFNVLIDSDFRRQIAALSKGSFKDFAEKLILCLGICPGASTMTDLAALDASAIKEVLLDNYADMCTEIYFEMWKQLIKNVIIPEERFTALPKGWFRLSPYERTALRHFFATRHALKRTMVKCAAEDDAECPICFEPACVSWVSLPSCGHQFHAECVLKLVYPFEPVRPKCPLCRAAIL